MERVPPQIEEFPPHFKDLNPFQRNWPAGEKEHFCRYLLANPEPPKKKANENPNDIRTLVQFSQGMLENFSHEQWLAEKRRRRAVRDLLVWYRQKEKAPVELGEKIDRLFSQIENLQAENTQLRTLVNTYY